MHANERVRHMSMSEVCHSTFFIYVDFSLLIAFFAGYTTSKYCHIN